MSIFVGPNTLGVLSPGKAVVGMIGGRAERHGNGSSREFQKASGDQPLRRNGVEHRLLLGQAGVRISTIAHIGGDAVLGIRIPDAGDV